MKIQRIALLGVVLIIGCDSKSTPGSPPSAIPASRGFKTIREDEPLFTHLVADPASTRHRLSEGLIHPDLPGEGNHALDESQTKLCFESITGTTLPESAKFVSGRMKRVYVFTKEMNPIRNSCGDGKLAFRVSRSAAGELMTKIVAELKRFDDENEVRYTWLQWEGKKDLNGYRLKVQPPLLDGNTSFRYAIGLSDRVRAEYLFIYDCEAEIFRIEYDYDNTRD